MNRTILIAVALVLLFSSGVQAGRIPGYIEVEKDNITVRVPVAIESDEIPLQGEYTNPPAPESGIDVRILFPADGLETVTSQITATGRAWSESSIIRVEYRVNGEAWTAASGTTSWTTGQIELVEGNNTIEVRTFDDRGRNATATVTVTYTAVSSDGEWRVYELSTFLVKKGGAFYTDTGFYVKVQCVGDGCSDKLHRQDPLSAPIDLTVYDSQGRLYTQTSTYSVGQFRSVPRKLDASYGLAGSNYDIWCTLYYKPRWEYSKISYLESGGGWTHIQNLKVYLYEPYALQDNTSISNDLVACSYNDDDWGWFYEYYNLYSIRSLSKSCYFDNPVVTGTLVVPGDKSAPEIGDFYAVNTTIYATYLTHTYGYGNYCGGTIWFGIYKPSNSYCSYNYIYHPTFHQTNVTNDKVTVRITDDSGMTRLERISLESEYQALGGEIKKFFQVPSPRVTVWMRGENGSWVQTTGYTEEFIVARDQFINSYYVTTRSVETEYFYTSAVDLNLQQGWNTIDVKAEDWTGKVSTAKVDLYYDTIFPYHTVSPADGTVITTPIFILNGTVSDDWGVVKVEAKIDQGVIRKEGVEVADGNWLTVATYPSVKNGSFQFKVIPDAAQTSITIRVTDESGNVREGVHPYTINAPPVAVITSHKDGETYTPVDNLATISGYIRTTTTPATAAYVKLNNGPWVQASINKGSMTWTVTDESNLLFEPNQWNTVYAKAVDGQGREWITYITIYYSEPDTIIYDFDTDEVRYKWSYGSLETGYSLPYASYSQCGPGGCSATMANVKLGLSRDYRVDYIWRSGFSRTYGGWFDYAGSKRFYVDGYQVSSAGTGAGWCQTGAWTNGSTATLPRGVHTLKWVVSQDANGYVSKGWTDDIVLRRDYSIWITSPRDGTVTEDMEFRVTGGTGWGVTKVELSVDNGPWESATLQTCARYDSWGNCVEWKSQPTWYKDLSFTSAGVYTFQARGYRAGSWSYSTTVTVTINATIPHVEITSPQDGYSYTWCSGYDSWGNCNAHRKLSVDIYATDPDGISSVYVGYDGDHWGGASPICISWDQWGNCNGYSNTNYTATVDLPRGVHELQVKAYDTKGSVGYSQSITVEAK